jgi:hypothetical protein
MTSAFAVLRETLIELGAGARPELSGVAGSQDLESVEVDVGGRRLLIESET